MKSWQEPYNNCPIEFIFLNSCASFQTIFSYRASVFFKGSGWVIYMQLQSCPGQLWRCQRPFPAHSGQKPVATVHPGAAQVRARSRRQLLYVLETRTLWLDSFSLSEGMEQPKIPLYASPGQEAQRVWAIKAMFPMLPTHLPWCRWRDLCALSISFTASLLSCHIHSSAKFLILLKPSSSLFCIWGTLAYPRVIKIHSYVFLWGLIILGLILNLSSILS